MKYILSLSFGKDSMAMLLEIIKRKLPLDYVVFCDIMFNDKISGEHPLMAEWIPKAEKILNDKFNITIDHVTAKKNFTEQFHTKKGRGKHQGDHYGFPFVIGAWCNGRLKLAPLANYMKDKIKQFGAITEYIGIAKDEPKRLERYKNMQTENHKYITLADLDITEQQAFEICEKENLLSPKYKLAFRSGCWFCPKQNLYDLYLLWRDYPKYYKMLEDMEPFSHNTFKPTTTLERERERFLSGFIPKQRKKRKKYKQITMFD